MSIVFPSDCKAASSMSSEIKVNKIRVVLKHLDETVLSTELRR